MSGSQNDVIDLLSDSDDDDNDDNEIHSSGLRYHSSLSNTANVLSTSGLSKPPFDKTPLSSLPNKISNPYILDRSNLPTTDTKVSKTTRPPPNKKKKRTDPSTDEPRIRQAGIVLQEDLVGTNTNTDYQNDPTVAQYMETQQRRIAQGETTIELFTDETFPTLPSSIYGPKKTQETKKIKCRCKGYPLAKLDVDKDGKPFYRCMKWSCKFSFPALTAERFHWYRFGQHNGHCIVHPTSSTTTTTTTATTAAAIATTMGFTANDLQQGRVGDCWFLSALAVVAERSDLISSLFPSTTLNKYGIIQVNLFLDGYWKPVIIDNFLPCMIDPNDEKMLQQTLNVSAYSSGRSFEHGYIGKSQSSKHDPNALSDTCRDVLRNTKEFLEHIQRNKRGGIGVGGGCQEVRMYTDPVCRPLTSSDFAYSKGLKNQLWVPLLEKAYAKSHGSYQAISGGHIAEAFLDLTGAPTLVFRWLDSPRFDYIDFWNQLMKFRNQRLPMGCGTDQSQVGIIGMHAYSILDVVEVKNVSPLFYEETGAAHGGMSGFGVDGTVRLLQIRNPHGKSEWKGDFSDRSNVWEKLRLYAGGRSLIDTPGLTGKDHRSPSKLERTMKNDGKFWIDYDSFLQGFSNVDVVLAFLGNHAKSFGTSFPAKKSNQRCTNAFEVCVLDESREVVELYVMGIQKTRRGAGHGRADRKVSYKVCDLGLLIGVCDNDPNRDIFDDSHAEDGRYWLQYDFSSVGGQMFGFQRNGHHRLTLRRSENKSFVVMPVSFGHPAATDSELSFVLRFVSDAPVLIRELPAVPRLDKAIQKFCLSPTQTFPSKQGRQTLLLQGPSFRIIKVDCLRNRGGVVFIYLCVDEQTLCTSGYGLSFSMEARCRGMSCRTAEGLLQHETIAKGKTFEAAWRKYHADFHDENQSRLLAVLFQSGQDYEFGGVSFTTIKDAGPKAKSRGILEDFMSESALKLEHYTNRGIFNGLKGMFAYETSSNLDMEAPTSNNQPNLMDANQLEGFLLQHALEVSKQEAASNNTAEVIDSDLLQAIAASKKGIDGSPNVVLSGDEDQSMDEDLKRALELSLEDSKPSASAIIAQRDVEVLDLTEVVRTTASTKPDNTEREKAKATVEGESLTAACKIQSIEEKRRLAAEAAMRRFGPK